MRSVQELWSGLYHKCTLETSYSRLFTFDYLRVWGFLLSVLALFIPNLLPSKMYTSVFAFFSPIYGWEKLMMRLGKMPFTKFYCNEPFPVSEGQHEWESVHLAGVCRISTFILQALVLYTVL